MPLKLPPHDRSAEVAVLAAMMLDASAVIKVTEVLESEHFYEQQHRLMYEAMTALHDQRKPIDVVTVTDQLKRKKSLKAAGGAAAVGDLAAQASTAANVEYYAQIIREAAIKRRMIQLSSQIGDLAFDEAVELAEMIDQVEQEVFQVASRHQHRSFVPLRDALTDSFERLDQLQRSNGELRGVPSGFVDVDNVLAGFQPSNLVVLAARPGMGKTAFSLNIAQSMAVFAKKRVGFFSLEMSKEELVDRLLVSQADIDAWRLKTGRLEQADYMKLSEAMGVLAEVDLFIDDSPGLTIYEMRTRARRLMLEHAIDVLFVDYLQLAHGRTHDNRVQEVAEISQGLKNIARELKIPVIALSQLSRAIESRGDKSPQLSDLRESGSIEQDADVVMFLYRKDDDLREAVTLKIAKHRNGPLGEIELFFRGDRIKFYGMETRRG